MFIPLNSYGELFVLFDKSGALMWFCFGYFFMKDELGNRRRSLVLNYMLQSDGAAG